MKKKISFQNMPHSIPLEQHAETKLEKITEFLRNADAATPFNVELHLKANKQHPHHGVEIHLKTPEYDLNAHEEGPDMYIVLDSAIDTIIALLKKAKGRQQDKNHKKDTEKNKFSSDKYKL